jgi:phenylpropionate dioxygenase-like ring-hydroxylating dioxygenase large terminal subunit
VDAATAPPVELPRHCTFDRADWLILSTHWFPVARIEDIGAAPVGAVLLDQKLVLYRAGEDIVVADDLCPHRGVPLSLGVADGDGIRCAYHGLRFGAQGQCVHVPASPDNRIPTRLHLRTYKAQFAYGLVWTRLRAPAADDPAHPTAGSLPRMPHWDNAGFQQITCPPFDIAGFAGRQMEGFLDVAHFAWVHTATFGDPANSTVPSYMPARHDLGFSVDYRSTVANYPTGVPNTAPPGFVWLRHFDVHLPFTATLTVHFPGPARLVIMNAASPVSARATRLFAPIARNFDQHIPIADVHEFNRRVFEEDRRIVEAQKPEFLPLDPSLEAHIPADRSSIAYRGGLRDLGFSPIFAA